MKKDYLFYVYIMSNFERNVFYIGFTNNLARRVIEHREGIGSEFTKKYNLKFLIYYEEFKYVDNALVREKEIKKWRREKKIILIKEMNLDFRDLGQEVIENYGLSEEDYRKIVADLKIQNRQ